VSLEADLKLAVAAGLLAGDLARQYFGQPLDVRNKTPNNPVTDADLAVDALLRDLLMADRPDYGWLSEETVDDGSRLVAERTWVVDPIDGTRAFIKGKPHWTICIGLMHGTTAVLGVVYNPISGEFFQATQGGGAMLNGAPIKASMTASVAGCAMLGDVGMFAHPAWPVAWPKMAVDQRNSIAYRMCLVANGAFDAAIALSAKQDWDLAAATVIAQEAGALATDHEGKAFAFGQPDARQKSLVVAGPKLHPLLIERVSHVRLV
jgi:myo-inositol-1(or 4)-monophosphatase